MREALKTHTALNTALTKSKKPRESFKKNSPSVKGESFINWGGVSQASPCHSDGREGN